MSRWGWLFVALLLLALLLAGCREDAPSTNEAATAVPAEIPTAMPTAAVPETVTETEPTAVPTATAVPVTPTPDKPLAVLVNDQPIYLDDYEKELARYEQAYLDLGDTPPVDYRDVVLNSLIERALIVQAANAQGISVTAEAVDARL
ncbi:MAG: SurA N-terminal domain-containing protein, partial [Anaerolineales bacterium]|nr:SurA N-terminal domain-containing protein [Anaerolineales bacterium]